MVEDKKTKFTQPLRVLVVEDNQVDKRMLESMLQESSEYASFLKISNSLSSALEMLEQHAFDVVILDLNLPDSKGIATLSAVNSKFPNVAIVVNTGVYEDELGLETLSNGAQDFLVKGKYNAYVLNKVLHYALERKRLEVELRGAYHKLKAAQAQLVQSEKMKVVGGLASGVAHEVKNPLATILYGVTYLSQQLKTDDEKIKTVIFSIKEATERANTIITDLLDFANLSRLNMKTEDINSVIEKALVLVNHEFEKNRIGIAKTLMDGLPKVNIDKIRIEQVFINLLLNAAHAMPEGGKLEVTTFNHKLSKELKEFSRFSHNGFKPGQDVIIVYIDDNGCGIPEDKIDKIFDPFFTTRRGYGGVGLGLSVSKNIIDSHHGYISIENRQNGGARATLILKVQS